MTVALLVLGIAATATATASAAATSSSASGLDLEALEATDRDAPKAIEARAEQGTIVDEIEVSAQRIAEASRPDTQLRITGRQLIERGVTNLAQALDLISDTPIRSAGRGGFQSDIRGARKGGVLMLLDGIPIADPYLGNFDVTSIPATDIAEIRVSLTPASPLDGPSGNGGVIEILTRAASGPKTARASVQASDAPGAVASATGRAPIAAGLGVRVSGQALMGNRDYVFSESNNPAMGREDARGGNAGLRIEQTFEKSRLSADFGVQRRAFLIPPTAALDQSEMGSSASNLEYVRREDLFRGVAGAETRSGHVLLSAHAYTLVVDRDIDHYADTARTTLSLTEHIFAHRSGGNAQVDWIASDDLRLTAVTHLLVEGGNGSSTQFFRGMDLVANNSGTAPIIEPAAGISYAPAEWLTVDAAGGAGIPISVEGAKPWPEGKATATFTATSALQLKVTAARKGRLPSIKDRYDTLVGNSAVAPEQSTSLEAGLVYKPRKWLSLDVTGFYRLINGLIRQGPLPAMNGMPARNATTNVGDVNIAGGEARLEASPFRFLSLSASYQYAHQRYVGNDLPPGSQNPLDFFPAHRGEVGMSLRPDPQYGIWCRARYIGERSDKANTLAPYVTIDASAWYQLEALRVTLRGENLLGQSYEIHSGVPGFGRTLFLGLEGVLE